MLSLLQLVSLLPLTFAISQYTTPSQWVPAPTNGTDALAAEGLCKLETYLDQHQANSTCSMKTAIRRKDWDTLVPEEKRDYLNAVRCLQTLPSIAGDSIPGARSRFDDFVGVHMNQTLTIHNTGNFFLWHRWFVYTYELALREECGYKGYQPYLNWARLTNSVVGSPIFDGSDLSLGGNGLPVPRGTIYFPSAESPVTSVPSGSGGGCITSGPFVNVTTNLGPLGLNSVNITTPNPRADGFGYNPRCIRRDLNVAAALGTSDYNATKLVRDSSDIIAFQHNLEGPFNYPGLGLELGVHTAGHYILGGDPGGDFFTSPGDPYFYFHHAQIDRIYWMWQNRGLPERYGQITGTRTILNQPPSPNATLDDTLDLGVLDAFGTKTPSGKPVTLRELMSTTDGPFCYIYE